MCYICSGKPIEEGEVSDKAMRYPMHNRRQWETPMLSSCVNEPLGFCLACIFPPCCICKLRKDAIHEWDRYKCCQGYICGELTDQCIPGQDSCPVLCLALEAILCPCFALSATRIYLADERQIQSDPCDNRIIRFNNCLQFLECICHIAAIFCQELDTLADLVSCIADLVYCITQSCMQAQTYHELKLHPTAGDY